MAVYLSVATDVGSVDMYPNHILGDSCVGGVSDLIKVPDSSRVGSQE